MGIVSSVGSTGAAGTENDIAAHEPAAMGDGSIQHLAPLSYTNQVAPRRLADTSTYDNEPYIEVLNDGTLIVIYRTSGTNGGGHVNNTGKIVAKRSTDGGNTWGNEITVADDPDYDTRNQSLIYESEDHRLCVHYRTYDASSGTQHGEYYKTSTDGGQTWSSASSVSLSYATGSISAAFGGYVETSNGLLTLWYGSNASDEYGVIEGLFSTDGGQTWGNNVEIGDTTNVSGRTLTEPVPAAFTEDDLWTWGRDNDTADFFAIQSMDGGDTWGSPVYFNPTGQTSPVPVWVKQTNANELTAVWGDRTHSYMYYLTMSAQLAWQDPTAMADEEVERLSAQLSSSSREFDFGYPTFTRLGQDRRNTVVAFYDESFSPNVWLMSLP